MINNFINISWNSQPGAIETCSPFLLNVSFIFLHWAKPTSLQGLPPVILSSGDVILQSSLSVDPVLTSSSYFNSIEDVFVGPHFAWSFIFEFWSCKTCQYGFISYFFKYWDPLVLCLRLLWVYQGCSLSSSLPATNLNDFVVYMNYLEHSCLSVPWHLCSKIHYQAWHRSFPLYNIALLDKYYPQFLWYQVPIILWLQWDISNYCLLNNYCSYCLLWSWQWLRVAIMESSFQTLHHCPLFLSNLDLLAFSSHPIVKYFLKTNLSADTKNPN